MDLTDCVRLPFPEGNDPGNGALDLQVLAEAIDAKATAQLASFRTILNKPVRIYQFSSMLLSVPSGVIGTDVFATSTWTAIYDNTGTPATSNGFSQVGMGTTPGIYKFGMYLATAPTGAVNVGTLRNLNLQVLIPGDPSTFPGSFTTENAFSLGYDPNSGLHVLQAEMEIYTPFPSSAINSTAGTRFSALFSHLNTSSPINFSLGLSWLYRAADVVV